MFYFFYFRGGRNQATNYDKSEGSEPETHQKRKRSDENDITSNNSPTAAVLNPPILSVSTPKKNVPLVVSATSSPTSTPSKRTYKFQTEWENQFLVTKCEDNQMCCMLCGAKMQLKKDTATKHVKRKHPELETMSQSRKTEIIHKHKTSVTVGQHEMSKFLGPQKLIQLAPLKCAFVI